MLHRNARSEKRVPRLALRRNARAEERALQALLHRNNRSGDRPPLQPVYLAEGAAVLLFLAFFFYRSAWALLFLLPLLYPLYRRRCAHVREREQKELTGQFKEAMNSVLTALKAGYSPENAFRECWPEMAFLFGRRSPICRELRRIAQGLDSNVPLEQLLADLGERSALDDVREFAQIFAIAKRSGGNMTEILGRTIALLQERMEVEKEIGVMLSARRLEQRIMDAAPFGIVLYVGVTSRGFFDPLYHNPTGVAVMSVCLAVYLTAFVLSEKITAIRM